MNKSQWRPRESYGGYLPLEISHSRIHKHQFDKVLNILSLNTVNAGIPLIQRHIKKDTVYCPYYLCPNVISVLENCFKRVLFYNIGTELVPEGDIFSDPSAAVYVVDYFGIIGSKTRDIVQAYRDTTFIVDNAHAFFEKPVIRENVYTLYSCRKFFGVPDGAHLVSKEKINCDYEEFQAWAHSEYLLKSLECGTNAAYADKKAADSYLLSHPAKMSMFSQALLESIDYDLVRKKRRKNFLAYEQELGESNQINCEKQSIPYIYPFNIGKNIKRKLIEMRIYVPTLWGGSFVSIHKKSVERNLSENTIFLPLDQRYTSDDIKHICFIVKELVEHSDG